MYSLTIARRGSASRLSARTLHAAISSAAHATDDGSNDSSRNRDRTINVGRVGVLMRRDPAWLFWAMPRGTMPLILAFLPL